MHFENFTERAQKVVDIAAAEASQLKDTSVDTVHLLVGMVREGNGIAAVVLAEHGIDATILLDARSSVCDEPDVSLTDVESRSKKEATWFKHH